MSVHRPDLPGVGRGVRSHADRLRTALVRNVGLVRASAGLFLAGMIVGAGLALAVGMDPVAGTGAEAGASTGTQDGGSAAAPDLGAVEILVNNVQVFGLLVSGSLTLGVTTLLSLGVNGLLFGAVGGAAVAGGETVEFALLTAPHVVLEFPAFFLAAAAGLKFPYELSRYARGRKSYVVDDRELVDAIYLTGASVAVLAVAAVVEAHLPTALVALLG